MEFWGVEVEFGEQFEVKIDDKILHITQAALGESGGDKDESVSVFMKVDGQKFVLGSLSPENTPQVSFDLVLDRDFGLSHNWKSGSVFFLGYKAGVPNPEEMSSDESESDDEIPLPSINDTLETKIEPSIPATAKASAPKIVSSENPEAKALEDSKPKEDDTDESSDPDYGIDGSDEMDTDGSNSSSDEEHPEDEDEDEETAKMVEPSKKRATESAAKTPVPAKKAKFVSPEKTESKKVNHIATPYPSKQGQKASAGGNKKDQTPKSNTQQVMCRFCSRAFNSEAGLQSHTKAKHEGK